LNDGSALFFAFYACVVFWQAVWIRPDGQMDGIGVLRYGVNVIIDVYIMETWSCLGDRGEGCRIP